MRPVSHADAAHRAPLHRRLHITPGAALRVSASATAPTPAHDAMHALRHDCRHTRRASRHGAPHRCPRPCRQSLPRTTIRAVRSSAAAAPLRRLRRRRFPHRSCSRSWPSRPPGAALGLTPHAAGCKRAHARAEPAFCVSFAASGRLWLSASCWSESMLWRTVTKLLKSRAFPGRGSPENRPDRPRNSLENRGFQPAVLQRSA